MKKLLIGLFLVCSCSQVLVAMNNEQEKESIGRTEDWSELFQQMLNWNEKQVDRSHQSPIFPVPDINLPQKQSPFVLLQNINSPINFTINTQNIFLNNAFNNVQQSLQQQSEKWAENSLNNNLLNTTNGTNQQVIPNQFDQNSKDISTEFQKNSEKDFEETVPENVLKKVDTRLENKYSYPKFFGLKKNKHLVSNKNTQNLVNGVLEERQIGKKQVVCDVCENQKNTPQYMNYLEENFLNFSNKVFGSYATMSENTFGISEQSQNNFQQEFDNMQKQKELEEEKDDTTSESSEEKKLITRTENGKIVCTLCGKDLTGKNSSRIIEHIERADHHPFYYCSICAEKTGIKFLRARRNLSYHHLKEYHPGKTLQDILGVDKDKKENLEKNLLNVGFELVKKSKKIKKVLEKDKKKRKRENENEKKSKEEKVKKVVLNAWKKNLKPVINSNNTTSNILRQDLAIDKDQSKQSQSDSSKSKQNNSILTYTLLNNQEQN